MRRLEQEDKKKVKILNIHPEHDDAISESSDDEVWVIVSTVSCICTYTSELIVVISFMWRFVMKKQTSSHESSRDFFSDAHILSCWLFGIALRS